MDFSISIFIVIAIEIVMAMVFDVIYNFLSIRQIIKPFCLLISFEPSELSFGKSSGVFLDFFDCKGKSEFFVKITK